MKSLAGKLIPLAVVLVVAISVVFVLESLNTGSEESGTELSLPSVLLSVKEKTGGEIAILEADTKKAAEIISREGYAGVQDALSEARSDASYAVSYGFMSSDGVLEAVSPEQYSESVGLNIGSTEPAKTILSKREAYMTGAFTTQEGFYAVEFSYPVLSDEGSYTGSVLCMAEPYKLLSDIISPVENETSASFTVMQTDGLILYDKDSAQAGKNLFTDPFFSPYAGLRNLGHTICSKNTGYGTYTFYDPSSESEGSVKKQAYWDTVENPGSEWRIILFKPVVSSV